MKLPKTITLMGTKWTVKWKDLSDKGSVGLTDFKTNTICIDPAQTPLSAKSTYLHEVLHVIVYLMAMHKTLCLDEDQIEILILQMETGLFAAFQAGLFNELF